MSIDQFIRSLDLSVGQTYRCNCPSCNGHNTFTVTNDTGNLLYNCYKAGCGISGAKHTNMDVFTIKTLLSSGMYSDHGSESYVGALQETFELPPYLTPIKPDTKAVRDFHVKWNINPDDTFYDIRQDRVVFAVFHGDRMVDAVGRSLDGTQPKWLRYGSSPVPFVHPHTPKTTSNRVGIIVEDVISAYTAHELTGIYGIALLGTQLTPFHKWYIAQYFDSVIVALDPDALPKTMSIVKELRGSMTGSVSALKLTDDLKYARDDDISKLKELLNET